MASYLDPAIQQQIEDFHRRMQAMRLYYQQAAATLGTARSMYDVEQLHKLPKPRHRLTFGRKPFIRSSSQLWQQFIAGQHALDHQTQDGQTHATPQIIIINVDDSDVPNTDSFPQLSNSNSKEVEP